MRGREELWEREKGGEEGSGGEPDASYAPGVQEPPNGWRGGWRDGAWR